MSINANPTNATISAYLTSYFRYLIFATIKKRIIFFSSNLKLPFYGSVKSYYQTSGVYSYNHFQQNRSRHSIVLSRVPTDEGDIHFPINVDRLQKISDLFSINISNIGILFKNRFIKWLFRILLKNEIFKIFSQINKYTYIINV